MTTANKISIVRVLLVPFFIVELLNYAQGGPEWHRLLAVLAFATAALSDGVDGYVARRYNQRSELGAILDPVADKLLLVSGVILLSLDNEPRLPRIPLWLTVTIVSRDMLLALGAVIVYYACGKVTVRPILIGKAATVLQMGCVLWGLLKWPPLGFGLIAWAAALSTTMSGLYYVYEGVRQLSASPSSGPVPRQE